MQSTSQLLRDGSKRFLDAGVAAILLALFSPLILVVGVVVKLDSRGPVFYRCVRVGFRGQELRMLKFRKMHDGAAGPALTSSGDSRLTRIGRWLTRSKIDEIPQLWNVLRGQMSLVGPRPEHPSFVELRSLEYATILGVRPGMTGLSQLAFARESEILDPEDTFNDYVLRVLPQKIALDGLYADNRSLLMDLRILRWTAVAVLLRREVAVDRRSGKLKLRRRVPAPSGVAVDIAHAEVEV